MSVGKAPKKESKGNPGKSDPRPGLGLGSAGVADWGRPQDPAVPRRSESGTSLLQGPGSTVPVVPSFPEFISALLMVDVQGTIPPPWGLRGPLVIALPGKTRPSHPNTSHPNSSHPNVSYPNSSHPTPTHPIPPHPTPKAVALPARPASGLQRKVAHGRFSGHSAAGEARRYPGCSA